VIIGASGRFHDPARFDAVGTDNHFLDASVVDCPDPLQIWIEPSFVEVVGVAYVVPHHRLFTAYFTHSGHARFSLSAGIHPAIISLIVA
jgi:hypothetical protein